MTNKDDMRHVSIEEQKDYKFPKRKGTPSLGGQLYEMYLCMLVLLKKENDFISNIYLASNVDKGADLDDVVIRIDYKNDKKKILFIQAKHKDDADKSSKICMPMLLSETGSFCLKRYLQSYLKIKKQFEGNNDDPIFQCNFEDCQFILYTNSLPHEKFDESYNSDIRKIQIKKVDLLYLKENQYYYKLIPNEEVRHFLKDSCNSRKLAKVMIECIKNNELMNEDFIEKYQAVLMKKVFIKSTNDEVKFKESFLNGIDIFNKVFFEEINEANISLSDLTNTTLRLPKNFGSKAKVNVTLPEDDVCEKDVEDFLTKLRLFVGQPNKDELNELLKIRMQKTFKLKENMVNNVFSQVEVKVREWWEKGTNYLTKDNNFFQEVAKYSVWYNVKAPIKSFTGRSEELKQLHEKLQKNVSKVTVISQITSISGLGGIGKTELARRYAQKYSKNYYDDNVIWINADTEETLSDSFTHLAKDKLQISIKNLDGTSKSINSIVGEIYEFFSTRKCLFIFDNADKTDILYKYLPLYYLKPSDEKPFVLITSRIAKWDMGIKVLSLNELKMQEAEDLLRNSLQITNQDETVKELILKLQGFPLALQQAIAYIYLQIGDDENYSIKQFLKEFDLQTKILLDSKDFQGIDNQYAKTTFTTWHISIDKISKDENFGPLALEILEIISYCAPDEISKKFFIKFEDKDEITVRNAIRLLANYSLIKNEQKSINIHRLVQQVTRLKNKENEVNILTKLINLLCENQKEDIIEHALSTWKHSCEHETLIGSYIDFWNEIFRQLQSRNRFKEAFQIGEGMIKTNIPFDGYSLEHLIGHLLLFRLNLKIYAELLIECVDIVLIVYNLINLTETGCCKRNEMVAKCNEVLKEQIILLDKHPGIAHYVNFLTVKEYLHEIVLKFEIAENEAKKGLGIYFYLAGNRAKASQIFKEIYELEKRTLNVDSPEMLLIHQYLVCCKSSSDDAIKICNEYLEKFNEILGFDHVYILTTEFNLAKSYMQKDLFDEACKILKKLIDNQIKIFGNLHHNTLLSQYNLAVCCYRKGDYDTVVKLLNNFDMHIKQLGIDNKIIATIQSNLADGLTKFMYVEAMKGIKYALKTHCSDNTYCKKENLPEKLADLLKNEGKREVIELFKNIMLKLIPNENNSLNFIRESIWSLKKTNTNINVTYDDVFKIMKAIIDDQTDDSLSAQYDLVYFQKITDKHDETIKFVKDSIKMKMKILYHKYGPNNRVHQWAHKDLVYFLKQIGENDEAVAMSRKGIEEKQTVTEKVKALHELAMFLVNIDKNDDALVVLKEMYEKSVAGFGYGHPNTLFAEKEFICFLNDQGKIDEINDILETAINEKILATLSNIGCFIRNIRMSDIVTEIFQDYINKIDADHVDRLNAEKYFAHYLKNIGKGDEGLKIMTGIIRKSIATFGLLDDPLLISLDLDNFFKYEDDKIMQLIQYMVLYCERLNDPTDPATIYSKNCLAHYLKDFGNIDSSITVLNKFKELFKEFQQFNSFHGPEAVMDFLNKNNKQNEGLKIFEQIATETAATLGDDHIDTLTVKFNLALLLREANKIDESIEIFREVIEKLKKTLGKNDLNTMEAEHELCYALVHKTDKHDEAIKILKENIDKKYSVFGGDDVYTIDARIKLGEFLKMINRHDEAIEILKNSIDYKIRVQGNNIFDTIHYQRKLGFYLINIGRYDEAINIFKDIINGKIPTLNTCND